MTYVANTAADQQAMLETIGVDSVEALFEVVPESVRFPRLNLARPLSEMEVLADILSNLLQGDTTLPCWMYLGRAYAWLKKRQQGWG